MNIASNKNIKVVLIGCGRIAGHHIQSIHQTDGIDIIGVCDLVEEKAKNYSDEYNIPHFTNYHNMLSEINVIDLTNSLIDLSNYKHYYLEDKHGGHFSADGNRLVAEIILNDIKEIIK